jgi:hypothetical protein
MVPKCCMGPYMITYKGLISLKKGHSIFLTYLIQFYFNAICL